MTSCISHSGEKYGSCVWFDAESRPGVRFGIVRISFGRRIDLARRIREIGRKAEFLDASGDVREKLESTVLAVEIDRAHLEWGLMGVEGIEIDGATATPVTLIETGPVELTVEILKRIKCECGLTDAERKN